MSSWKIKIYKKKLVPVSANFGFIVDTFSKPETSKIPSLNESLYIVYNVIKQFERILQDTRVSINLKLQDILKKPGS